MARAWAGNGAGSPLRPCAIGQPETHPRTPAAGRALWPGAHPAVVALLGLLLLFGPALALDPGKALTQYVRRAWQADQGLPQVTVQAVAQTPDGYLWLGTALADRRDDVA